MNLIYLITLYLFQPMFVTAIYIKHMPSNKFNEFDRQSMYVAQMDEIKFDGKITGVERKSVKFDLYNRDYSVKPFDLKYGKVSEAFPIKPKTKQKYKILLHGYRDNARDPWLINMKHEYLNKEDCNVIIPDWTYPAYTQYPFAANHTPEVGGYIADLILELHTTLNVPYEDIHIVGHCLGAHVAGFAGKKIKKIADGEQVGRITGLDPAGPLFNMEPEDKRLSKGDAKFVDVIHTDKSKYGYNDDLGTVDFYPNNGEAIQPGCPFGTMGREIVECSHFRAITYFTESINGSPDDFISHQCDHFAKYIESECESKTKGKMGEHVDKGSSGTHYLTTNPAAPFATKGTI